MKTFDLAIIGSGFGGSLLAMIARRLNLSVVLIDKGTHPRFAIGESSTPLSNLLWEELCARYDLPRLAPLAKWGSWQREYPEIACGLKRGFTFYAHQFDREYGPQSDRANQLLVAASPHDELADTHWYRPEFDQFLAHEAQKMGAELFENTQLQRIEWNQNDIILHTTRGNETLGWRAKFVVDASGARGFLTQALNLKTSSFAAMPPTQTLFAHFVGVEPSTKWAIASTCREIPPYPPDCAALHHVFAGGWMWILPFNNGITSAGVMLRDDVAQQFGLQDKAVAWQQLLEKLPSVQQQFRGARAVSEFVFAPRPSFCVSPIVGNRWALLPGAAGFVDPLLSTGFALTLLGIARLAPILAQLPNTTQLKSELETYAAHTQRELNWVAEIIGALYANLADFGKFSALSLLYFAAASFSETARRLNRPELARGFLLCDEPDFATEARRCLQLSRDATVSAEILRAEVLRVIASFDVAGLGREQNNWYGVEARDLFDGAAKVQSNATEIEAMLQNCGFYVA